MHRVAKVERLTGNALLLTGERGPRAENDEHQHARQQPRAEGELEVEACDERVDEDRQRRRQEQAERLTRELPYGKRRLLEIAIALACEPKVLLLDEPVAGVPAGEREELLQTVAALPADVSVLLIEHDMDLVFDFARRITVLVNGAVLTEGEPGEIANDARVKAVYLGHGPEVLA